MDPVDETDATLIRRSLTAPEAFGGIYDRHRGAIMAFMLRRVSSDLSSDVEDLIADVFVTAFRNRRRYDLNRPNSLPWLYGIARNVLRNQYRWWERQKRRSATTPVDPEVADVAERAVERADAQALLATLGPSLDGLQEHERHALELLADGHSYREIAERVGCEIGTVKSRISRARAKLER